eukprot:gb/GEZN01007583.1/.p1 GENE.gb/GEZN01007583.1/~~gb/GEZN01007583.1/.p1  ORF type:complete len:306 (+),score=34.26 gb/GEZN01007583.1/:383-1300(+)
MESYRATEDFLLLLAVKDSRRRLHISSAKFNLHGGEPQPRATRFTDAPHSEFCAAYFVCGYCGAPAASKCGSCAVQKYCSSACQKMHWGTHRLQCAGLQQGDFKYRKRLYKRLTQHLADIRLNHSSREQKLGPAVYTIPSARPGPGKAQWSLLPQQQVGELARHDDAWFHVLKQMSFTWPEGNFLVVLVGRQNQPLCVLGACFRREVAEVRATPCSAVHYPGAAARCSYCAADAPAIECTRCAVHKYCSTFCRERYLAKPAAAGQTEPVMGKRREHKSRPMPEREQVTGTPAAKVTLGQGSFGVS